MTAGHGERGMALVVVLIFTTAMAAAAVAFLAGRQSDALSLRGQLQAVEAQAMLDAALQQTVAVARQPHRTQIDARPARWQFGNVAVQVRLESESRQGRPQQGRRIRCCAGCRWRSASEEDQATALTDAVQDWRDDNQLKLAQWRGGPRLSERRRAPRGAADRPFASPAELLYLPAVDRAIWALLAPLRHGLFRRGAAGCPQARCAGGPRAIEIARGLAKSQGER